jgi:hypothetical protein
VSHEIQQEEVILRNTFINAKMGPIVQFLGGPNASIPKTFQIRWPDENSTPQNRQPLVLEIVERPGSKANHKHIKASQLKSNLKVSKCLSIEIRLKGIIFHANFNHSILH